MVSELREEIPLQRARLAAGLVGLVILIALALSPIGLPAHIQWLRQNFAEAERLHAPSCHDCGRPAARMEYGRGSPSSRAVVFYCPQHSRASTNVTRRLFHHWLTVAVALASFQVFFPLSLIIGSWRFRRIPINVDEVATKIEMLVAMGVLVALHFLW